MTSGAEFDLTALGELADACSRREFVATFARDSLRDMMHALDGLGAEGERGGWETLRDRAHAIKGIASNIGATRVAACADAVMRRADAQMPAAWRDDLQRLREALASASDALDDVLRKIDARAPHE